MQTVVLRAYTDHGIIKHARNSDGINRLILKSIRSAEKHR